MLEVNYDLVSTRLCNSGNSDPLSSIEVEISGSRDDVEGSNRCCNHLSCGLVGGEEFYTANEHVAILVLDLKALNL